MRLASLAAVAVTTMAMAPAPASAAPTVDLTGHRVVFARAGALWTTDARGKGPAKQLATLPPDAASGDVRAIRTDAAGTALVVDLGGRWWWLPLDGSRPAFTELPCATGAVTFAPDGTCVVCATATGDAQLVQLATGRATRRAVPSAGAAVIGTGATAELVWSDADGIWAAPVTAGRDARATRRHQLAPAPPLRGLSIGPDGRRALGVYSGVLRKGKVAIPTEHLYTFLLDGRAAKRKSIRAGVVVAWSDDGAWALVQDGTSACVMRVVGGEYKCWKGFTAAALSGDGNHALLLGARDGVTGGDDDDRDGDPGGDGEGGEDAEDPTADADAAIVHHGPMSIYRAIVPGTYTEKPALVEKVIDGAAAAWLDAP